MQYSKGPWYLAAPYSPPKGCTDPDERRAAIDANVEHAALWWSRLTHAGYFVVVPHTSVVLDRILYGIFDDQFWYDYTMRLMVDCCPAGVVLIPDGPMPREHSAGTQREAIAALDLGRSVVNAPLLLRAAYEAEKVAS